MSCTNTTRHIRTIRHPDPPLHGADSALRIPTGSADPATSSPVPGCGSSQAVGPAPQDEVTALRSCRWPRPPPARIREYPVSGTRNMLTRSSPGPPLSSPVDRDRSNARRTHPWSATRDWAQLPASAFGAVATVPPCGRVDRPRAPEIGTWPSAPRPPHFAYCARASTQDTVGKSPDSCDCDPTPPDPHELDASRRVRHASPTDLSTELALLSAELGKGSHGHSEVNRVRPLWLPLAYLAHPIICSGTPRTPQR